MDRPALRDTLKRQLTFRNLAFLLVLLLVQTAVALYFIRPFNGPASLGVIGLPSDDSWVFLQYGRNFAHHGWFYFNAGEAAAGPSGWLWTIVLAVGHWTLVPLGVSGAMMTRILGLLLGLLCAVLVYLVLKRATGRAWVGYLAAAVILCHPEFAYLELSGHSDGLTLIASMLLATWLLMRGAGWLLGIALWCLVWSRPEGIVFAGLVILVRLFLVARESLRQKQPKKMALAALKTVFLPAVAFGVWAGYTRAINGAVGTSGVTATLSTDAGLLPLTRLGYVWTGYLSRLPWFANPYLDVASVLMILTGAVTLTRRAGLKIVPLVVFPFLLLYLIGAFVNKDSGPWGFWEVRRYVDAVIPALLALAVAGAWYWGRWLATAAVTRIKFAPKPHAAALAAVLFVALLTPHVVAMLGYWPERYDDYERSIAGVERVYAVPARFAAAHTPEDAVIAVGLGGAAAYLTDRYIIELTGAQQPQYFGRSGYDIIAREKPDYVITFPDDRYTLSLPGAADISAGQIDSPMMVVKLDWSWQPADAAVTCLAADGDVVTDQFAPAGKDAAQAHGYTGGDVAYDPFVASLLPDGRAVIERGLLRRAPNEEEFVMATTPDRPARLVVRYDAVIGGAADVYVDGSLAGEWTLPAGDYALNEAGFTIPADLVTGSELNIKLVWQAGVSTFHYWLLSGQ